jgi:hypothetical protein
MDVRALFERKFLISKNNFKPHNFIAARKNVVEHSERGMLKETEFQTCHVGQFKADARKAFR